MLPALLAQQIAPRLTTKETTLLVHELIEALNALEDAEDLEVVYTDGGKFRTVQEVSTLRRMHGHGMPIDSVELA